MWIWSQAALIRPVNISHYPVLWRETLVKGSALGFYLSYILISVLAAPFPNHISNIDVSQIRHAKDLKQLPDPRKVYFNFPSISITFDAGCHSSTLSLVNFIGKNSTVAFYKHHTSENIQNRRGISFDSRRYVYWNNEENALTRWNWIKFLSFFVAINYINPQDFSPLDLLVGRRFYRATINSDGTSSTLFSAIFKTYCHSQQLRCSDNSALYGNNFFLFHPE